MINIMHVSLLLAVLWPSSRSIDIPLYCFDEVTVSSDYLVQNNGLIYRQASAGLSLQEPVLLADLRDSGWQFSTTHKVVHSWLPVTVFGSQQHFEQLMLLARDPISQLDQVVMVRLFPQQDTVWRFADLQPHLEEDLLASASTPSEFETIESLWYQLQMAAGWWRPLPGWAMQLPQLYAGILYIISTPYLQSNSCPNYPLDLSLYSIHMHSGHSIKVKSGLTLVQPGSLKMHLRASPEQQLSLWLEQQGNAWPLEPALYQITPDCLDCYQILDLSQWPQQLELATFWFEEGAY